MRRRSARQDPQGDVQGQGEPSRPGGPPGRYVNAFWHRDSVVLLTRSESGKLIKREVPADYTCFLLRSEVDQDLERKVRGSRHVIAVREEGDYLRVRWKSRETLRAACEPNGFFDRANVRTFEADLNPVRRFLTDNDIEIQKPRRAYLDLETDSRVPFTRKETARILTWGLVFEDGEQVLGQLDEDTDEAEVLLLEDLFHELFEVDQIIGWNLDAFDKPVLRGRIRHHGIAINPSRWLWLDAMLLFEKFNMSAAKSGEEKQSVALGHVANELLGTGKDAVDASKAWEIWKNKKVCDDGTCMKCRDCLGLYCVNDADLIRRIEEQTGFIDLLQTLGEVTTTFPDSRGMNGTNYVEGYLLKKGLEVGVHFRSHWGYHVAEKFEGAWVMEPTRTGILRNVHVCDFASLYPSVIESWNMSPETLDPYTKVDNAAARPSYLKHQPVKEIPLPPGKCKNPITKVVFNTTPPGVLAQAVTELKAKRQYFKKMKAKAVPGTPEYQYATRREASFKIGINTFYGVLGSPFSRFFERDVAESTAQGGVWLIKETIKAGEDRGMRGVYGDTDSLFIMDVTEERFRDFVSWCNAELYPDLLKSVGCERNEIELDYEKEFAILLLITKKRYAGRFRHYKGSYAQEDSEPEIKGLEYKRGDYTRLCRELQKQVVDFILADEHNDDVEFFERVVEWWKAWVLHGDLALGDFVKTNSLHKELKGYKRKKKKDGTWGKLSPHVEVAHLLAKRGQQVTEGTRIQYVVVDASKGIEAIPFEDYEPGVEDRYYLWENQVYPATQRVLEAAFPEVKWKAYLKARPKKKRARRTPDSQVQESLF